METCRWGAPFVEYDKTGIAGLKAGAVGPTHERTDKFDGAHKYVLHFDADKQPPVATFWNLAMYGPDMLFVENESGAAASEVRRTD